MNRTLLVAGACLTAGVGLGLGAGALLWRAAAHQAMLKKAAPAVTRPHSPPALDRLGAQGPERAGGASTTQGTGDRVAELAARFRAVKDASGEEERDSMFVETLVGLGGLSSEDFAQLLHLLAEPKLDKEVAGLPLLRWAALDPKAALSFALSREELKTTERIIAAIIHELAKTDLAAAKVALGQLENEERKYSQRAIVRLLQRNDPVAALAYARELGDIGAESDALSSLARTDPLAAAAELGTGRPGQEPAIAAIATGFAKRDRSAFEQWAAKLAEPTGRAVARRAALGIDMLTDPRKAAAETAAWLATEPAAEKAAGALPTQIAQHWWGKGGALQEIAAWAASLPGNSQYYALEEVTRLWVDRDIAAASEWLGTLPPSPGRDQAVGRLVAKVAKEAPDDAFEWARTIQDSSARGRTLTDLVRGWAGQDSAAAQAAVATLPPEQRGDLLGVIEKEVSRKK